MVLVGKVCASASEVCQKELENIGVSDTGKNPASCIPIRKQRTNFLTTVAESTTRLCFDCTSGITVEFDSGHTDFFPPPLLLIKHVLQTAFYFIPF